MVKRYTLDEIRAMKGRGEFSEMAESEKAAHLAGMLAAHKKRIEQLSWLSAEIRQRLECGSRPQPKLGLKTFDEVRAYVDGIMSGFPFR